MNRVTDEIHYDFVENLLSRASRTPDEVWLRQIEGDRWASYSWGQCASQVRRMANAIVAKGFAPGSRIAISGRNTAHWFLADLAIRLAGHVAVGLYPRQSADALHYIAEHAQLCAIFVGPSSDIQPMLAALPATLPRWALPYPEVPPLDEHWHTMIAEQADTFEYVVPPDEQLALLVYTSGTSGMPKAVMISAGALAFTARSYREHLLLPHGLGRAGRRERLLSYLPLAHFFERLACEGMSLLVGAEVYFLDSIEAMGATLEYVQPTFFIGVPLVYGRLRSAVLERLPAAKLERWLRIPLLASYLRRSIRHKLGLSQAKLVISAAAPISPALVTWFQRLGVPLMQAYGQSENCTYATSNQHHAHRPNSVGRALPGTELRFGDDDEILIRHPGLMAGYFRDDAATAAAFTEDGYLHSGDRGHLDQDGFLYITGRSKDIFKTAKGKYVAPAPIEELVQGRVIEHSCLVGPGLAQPILLATLTALARQLSRAELEQELLELMTRVNEELAPHAKIGKLVLLTDSWSSEGGLLTPTLKIRRMAIQARYAGLIERESADRRPLVWQQLPVDGSGAAPDQKSGSSG